MPVSSSTSARIVSPRFAATLRDSGGHLVGVERDGDRDALGQVGEARELGLTDDRVADEDVADAGVGHHLGLAELGDLDPDRASLHLHLARSAGSLCVFTCGRSVTPASRAAAAARSTFARTTSRSITISGVSGASAARAAVLWWEVSVVIAFLSASRVGNG